MTIGAIDFSSSSFSPTLGTGFDFGSGIGLGSGIDFGFDSSLFSSGLGLASLPLGIDSGSLFSTSYLRNRDNYNQAEISLGVANVGRDATLSRNIKNLVSYIEKGQEDKAILEYTKLLNEMRKQKRYSECSDEDLRAVSQTIIENTTGKNLEQLIRDNTRDNVEVEWQQWRTFDNCDSISQEDLLKVICGIDEDKGHATGFGKFLNGCASPFVWAWNRFTNGGKKM